MSKEQKQFFESVIYPVLAVLIVGAFGAFVSFKVLSAQFEDYKKTNEERIIRMEKAIDRTDDRTQKMYEIMIENKL